jgi:putative transposase
MIEQNNKELSVKHQCEILGISRSSAYYESSDVVCNNDLVIVEKIRKVLFDLPFYGYRKVSCEVRRRYFAVTEKQIRRIMARAGLKAIYPGKNLSKARQSHKKYPYLLSGKIIRYPNQVWATDLTYIKLPSGHVYLMAIIDLYSRKVLNWIISNTLDASIYANCLSETIKKYGAPAIFNTDQGCQFTSECWINVLLENGVEISMDGKNRALDNIYVERLWRSLKYEDIYIKHYESVRELKEGVLKYFRFYNEERFHQSLYYRTPDEMYESFQTVGLAEQVA